MKVSAVSRRLELPPEGGCIVIGPSRANLVPDAPPMSHASNGREAFDRRTGDIRHVQPEATHHG